MGDGGIAEAIPPSRIGLVSTRAGAMRWCVRNFGLRCANLSMSGGSSEAEGPAPGPSDLSSDEDSPSGIHSGVSFVSLAAPSLHVIQQMPVIDVFDSLGGTNGHIAEFGGPDVRVRNNLQSGQRCGVPLLT